MEILYLGLLIGSILLTVVRFLFLELFSAPLDCCSFLFAGGLMVLDGVLAGLCYFNDYNLIRFIFV